ncbi:hypothetical protein LINPERHAP1_LOCUS2862 [Linum perenne]
MARVAREAPHQLGKEAETHVPRQQLPQMRPLGGIDPPHPA